MTGQVRGKNLRSPRAGGSRGSGRASNANYCGAGEGGFFPAGPESPISGVPKPDCNLRPPADSERQARARVGSRAIRKGLRVASIAGSERLPFDPSGGKARYFTYRRALIHQGLDRRPPCHAESAEGGPIIRTLGSFVRRGGPRMTTTAWAQSTRRRLAW